MKGKVVTEGVGGSREVVHHGDGTDDCWYCS